MRDLLHQAIQLRRAGLINTSFSGESQHPHGFKDAQGTQSITIGRIFRSLKTHGYMALSAQIINFIRLHLLNNSNQVCAICEIAIMKGQSLILLMRILIKMINAAGVETTGTPLDAMHGISLLQQQLGQIGTILACDTGNEGNFHCRRAQNQPT